MTTTVVIQPEAEADLDHGFQWYQSRRAGLGHAFLDEAAASFARIAERPLLPAPEHRATRRAFLHRFPYVVIYVAKTDVVFVLTVLHQRRSPKIARARTQSFSRTKI